MENKVLNLFNEHFKAPADMLYFSPGRVNIIGEHIDYNGGKVLPMAISLGIFGALSFNDDNKCRVVSYGFDHERELTFDIDNFEKTDDFTTYIKGVIYVLANDYNKTFNKGFNLYLYSTLPASSGLSSSAAMELLISHIMNDYYNLGLDGVTLVKVSQKAENVYAKVNCGIMDQFACGMGKKNKVILLDTATIDYDYFDFDLGDGCLLILNTNKPRNLAESKYNERRTECDTVLEVLNNKYHKVNLCDYTMDELDTVKDQIKENEYRRARHAIKEYQRVLDATVAMKNKDLKKLGLLLNESHNSLRDDYEVSGLNLDVIAEEMIKHEHVLGSRMTGAGFSGCAIALIDTKDENIIANIMKEVSKVYLEKTGINLSYYIAESNDGTGRIK